MSRLTKINIQNIELMQKVKINDIIEFARNGASIKQSEGAKGFPISRIETIWNSTIDENRLGYANIFDEDLIKYKKYLLKENDILITHINSPKHLGKSAIYNGHPEKLIHGMNLLCLRNNPNLSNSKYLFYYFQTKYFKNQILKISNQSVNQASFAVTNLKDLEIPLPSLQTQQKIATILDKANELRQYNKQLIEKYDALTQSLFLDMFGDPVKNEKGYKIVKLDDVTTKITDGVHAKPEYTENGVPFISVKDITTGTLIFDKCKFISEEAHQKYYKRCNPEYDDILYTKVGATYGRSAIVNVKSEFSLYVSVALIKPKRELINPKYLKDALANPAIKRQADRAIKGIGVPDLHLNMIKNFLLPLPTLQEQNEFENRIEVIETQKQQAQEALAKIEELFQSLLLQAFKGELA